MPSSERLSWHQANTGAIKTDNGKLLVVLRTIQHDEEFARRRGVTGPRLGRLHAHGRQLVISGRESTLALVVLAG